MKVRHKNNKYSEHLFMHSLVNDRCFSERVDNETKEVIVDDRGYFVRVHEVVFGVIAEYADKPNVIKLVSWLCSNIPRDTPIIEFSQADIAKQFGYKSVKPINEAMSILYKKLIIDKIGLRTYIINPLFLYNGNRRKLYKQIKIQHKKNEKDDYDGTIRARLGLSKRESDKSDALPMDDGVEF